MTNCLRPVAFDMRGLLDAVAKAEMTAYMAEKARRASHPDPLQDLRDGWDMHIAFSLAHPGLFAIMSGGPSERPPSAAVAAGLDVLRQRIRRIALADRLRISEPRALALVHAMGTGTVLTLLAQPAQRRDPGLSDAAREAVMAAITGPADAPADPAAAALRASLDHTSVLTSGERHLLEELLDRIADGGHRPES
ncbi:TetR family transcriptional regulator [Nannocystis pusilla]|uniref:TetR family transcriptional regulator n=1 Tax=Nannocystis pusilla TaxID=889268 RepID=UPI003BF1DD3B